MHSYLKTFPIAVIHLDAQSKPVFANNAFLAFYGAQDFQDFKGNCTQFLNTIEAHPPQTPIATNINKKPVVIRYTRRAVKTTTNGEKLTELIIEALPAEIETQKELARQNDNLNTIINLTFDILLKIDFSYHVHWVSWQVEEILGYNTASMTNTNLLDFIHPEDQDDFCHTMRQISFNMNADIEHIRIRNKLNTWSWFRCRIYQIYLDGKEQLGAQVALHDEHLRVMAERSLRAREARYSSFIDNFPGTIIQFNFENDITFVNPSFKNITGFSTEVAYSSNFLENFIDTESLANFQSHLLIAQKGYTTQTEIIYSTLEGKLRTAIATIMPLSERDRVTSTCAVLRDITHEKLMQDQLIQTHKMETIGTMARGIAHEFNNILTGIIGNTAILRDSISIDEFTDQTISEIEHATGRCTELTRSLLTFSRQGKTSIEPTDLNTLVQTMIHFLRKIIPTSITIEAPTTLNLSPALVDQGQIQQVITNLVLNAHDAIKKQESSLESQGKISIFIDELEVSEENMSKNLDAYAGKFLRVSISDTGCGIQDENLSQIYDPFFSTKEVAQNSGMGLSIAFGIIKDHKGWIEVETEENVGTTFQFYLPTMDESFKENRYINEKLYCPGGTVLIVDDDELVRNVAKKSLERYGYHVLTAQNGEEAYAVYKANEASIDLLLIDLTMPALNGRALIAKIHRRNPEIKAILSSGYEIDGKFPDNNTKFLPKPYVMTDLIRLAGELLQK